MEMQRFPSRETRKPGSQVKTKSYKEINKRVLFGFEYEIELTLARPRVAANVPRVGDGGAVHSGTSAAAAATAEVDILHGVDAGNRQALETIVNKGRSARICRRCQLRGAQTPITIRDREENSPSPGVALGQTIRDVADFLTHAAGHGLGTPVARSDLVVGVRTLVVVAVTA